MRTSDGMNIPASKEALAGAAGYTKLVLYSYDLYVLKFEMKVVFKCPSHIILDFYNEHITDNHLDVGVGTGYFLDTCGFPSDTPTVHLMDLNPNSLQKTAHRIRRYHPITHHWNVLEPVREELPLFDSIGAGNLLHCLPGAMLSKEIFFKNLKPFLREGGVFFGLTVLGQGIDAGALFRTVNRVYNKIAIFSNLQDNLADLETILKNNFKDYSVRVVGSVAFFVGRV